MSGAEMSGAETARRRVVQRRIGGAETAAPKWPSPGRRTTLAPLRVDSSKLGWCTL